MIWDARTQADAILRDARAAGQEILDRASAEAEAGRRDALEAGREEGKASVLDLVLRARAERDRLLAASEQELVRLAFEVAGRVLSEIAQQGHDLVVQIASRALERVRRCSTACVRVHPEDLAALREAEPQLAASIARARFLAFVPDAGVSRGGVVVESDVGTVDARLSSQLDALRGALHLELDEAER